MARGYTKVLTAIAGLAAAALVHAATSAVQASVTLTNPGFETPAVTSGGEAPGAGTGWTPYNAVFTENVTGRGNLTSHEGSQVIKTFGGGSGVFQDIPVTPGQSWTASSWAEVSASDPPAAGQFGQLLIIYRDPSNTSQVGSTLASQMVTGGTTPLDVWQQGTLSGTVPAGVGFIRYQLNEGSPAGGAVFFDDNNLTFVVPEPASLGLIGLGGLLALRRRSR